MLFLIFRPPLRRPEQIEAGLIEAAALRVTLARWRTCINQGTIMGCTTTSNHFSLNIEGEILFYHTLLRERSNRFMQSCLVKHLPVLLFIFCYHSLDSNPFHRGIST